MFETRVASSSSTPPETLAARHQYVWSPRYIDAPILRDEVGGASSGSSSSSSSSGSSAGTASRLYYLTDANMNVTGLVNTLGTVVERCAYDPYGAPLFFDGNWTVRASSAYNNAILFAGYYRNAETGLLLARHRHMHPSIGAWVSRDPIEYAGGCVNLHAYVLCRPTTMSDSQGLFAMAAGTAGAGVGAKVVAGGIGVAAKVVAGAKSLAALAAATPALPVVAVIGAGLLIYNYWDGIKSFFGYCAE